MGTTCLSIKSCAFTAGATSLLQTTPSAKPTEVSDLRALLTEDGHSVHWGWCRSQRVGG